MSQPSRDDLATWMEATWTRLHVNMTDEVDRALKAASVDTPSEPESWINSTNASYGTSETDSPDSGSSVGRNTDANSNSPSFGSSNSSDGSGDGSFDVRSNRSSSGADSGGDTSSGAAAATDSPRRNGDSNGNGSASANGGTIANGKHKGGSGSSRSAMASQMTTSARSGGSGSSGSSSRSSQLQGGAAATNTPPLIDAIPAPPRIPITDHSDAASKTTVSSGKSMALRAPPSFRWKDYLKLMWDTVYNQNIAMRSNKHAHAVFRGAMRGVCGGGCPHATSAYRNRALAVSIPSRAIARQVLERCPVGSSFHTVSTFSALMSVLGSHPDSQRRRATFVSDGVFRGMVTSRTITVTPRDALHFVDRAASLAAAARGDKSERWSVADSSDQLLIDQIFRLFYHHTLGVRFVGIQDEDTEDDETPGGRGTDADSGAGTTASIGAGAGSTGTSGDSSGGAPSSVPTASNGHASGAGNAATAAAAAATGAGAGAAAKPATASRSNAGPGAGSQGSTTASGSSSGGSHAHSGGSTASGSNDSGSDGGRGGGRGGRGGGGGPTARRGTVKVPAECSNFSLLTFRGHGRRATTSSNSSVGSGSSDRSGHTSATSGSAASRTAMDEVVAVCQVGHLCKCCHTGVGEDCSVHMDFDPKRVRK